MSDHNHNHFFFPQEADGSSETPLDQYLSGLNTWKRAVLRSFYKTYCNQEEHFQHVEHTDGRKLLPTSITYGVTPHHLFVALGSEKDFSENPDNYALITCQEQGRTMHTEDYRVTDVKHVKSGRFESLDRILYAEGTTSGNKVAVEMGRKVWWLEKHILNGHETPVALPLQRFKLPADF